MQFCHHLEWPFRQAKKKNKNIFKKYKRKKIMILCQIVQRDSEWQEFEFQVEALTVHKHPSVFSGYLQYKSVFKRDFNGTFQKVLSISEC